MAILGSIPLSGFISPYSEQDTYPSHKAKYGHGGHRSVATVSDMEAIPVDRREDGMTIYVVDTGSTYQLQGGVDNDNLVLYSLVGGISAQQFKKPAAVDIPDYSLCIIKDDKADLADNSIMSQASATKYIATVGGATDDLVILVEAGTVTNSDWTLNSNLPVFVGNNGEVTTIPPTAGYVQSVGMAITSDTLDIEIGVPIKL